MAARAKEAVELRMQVALMLWWPKMIPPPPPPPLVVMVVVVMVLVVLLLLQARPSCRWRRAVTLVLTLREW